MGAKRAGGRRVVQGPGTPGPIKRGKAPGYDFQDQYIGIPGKSVADNMEPMIDHPDQTRKPERSWPISSARPERSPTSSCS
jgi:arylsulfatase